MSLLVILLGFLIGGSLFYMQTKPHLLSPRAYRYLTQGKMFWKWDSPWGPFNIHYQEKGTGDNHIILLHGFAAHTYTWQKIVDPLVEKGYHVWSIDFLGFGLSDKPDQVPYSLPLFVQQIKDFMLEKEIQQAHLIGNSMGGAIALGCTVTAPQLFKTLTLISALSYPLDLPFPLKVAKRWGRWMGFLVNKWTLRQCLKQIVYNPLSITEEQIRAYLLPYRLPGGLKAALTSLEKFDDQELINLGYHFKEIEIPTLIIWGENDTWLPFEMGHRLHQAIPGSKTLFISRCGHIPQEECPDQVFLGLSQFLALY